MELHNYKSVLNISFCYEIELSDHPVHYSAEIINPGTQNSLTETGNQCVSESKSLADTTCLWGLKITYFLFLLHHKINS